MGRNELACAGSLLVLTKWSRSRQFCQNPMGALDQQFPVFASYLIYKHFLSKIERCLIKNIFINHLYKTKRPGIAGIRPLLNKILKL